MKEISTQIPNKLILARYNTSASQRKIIYSILIQIEKVMEYTELDNDPVFEIPKSAVLDGKSDNDIKKICLDLMKKEILLNQDNANVEIDAIMPFRRIISLKNENIIRIILDKTIAGIFYEIKKGYTKINYLAALSLESKHAQKLYELFSMRINNFENNIWFTTITEIKEILGVTDKYTQNSHFREKVLNTIQKEINKHTNLTIEYELEKQGKSYHYLTFYINRKKEKTVLEKIETRFLDDKSKRCLELLIQIGINNKDLQNKIIKEHQTEFWKWNYATKTHKILIKTNHAGHLLKTLGLVK